MFLFMSSIFFCFSIVCSVGSVMASASGINHPKEIAQILFPCDTWDTAPNALQWDCEQCSSCRLCGQEAEAMSVYIWLRGRFISRAFSCWPTASTPYLLSCWSCLQMWWKSFETDFFLTDIWQLNCFSGKIDMICYAFWDLLTNLINFCIKCVFHNTLCILCLTITWISQVLTSCQNNILTGITLLPISALVNIWKFGLNVKLVNGCS